MLSQSVFVCWLEFLLVCTAGAGTDADIRRGRHTTDDHRLREVCISATWLFARPTGPDVYKRQGLLHSICVYV